MAIAFVTLITGMGTAASSSDIDRQQAQADVYLKQYAEQMKASVECTTNSTNCLSTRTPQYTACPATGSAYALPGVTWLPVGVTITVDRAQVWDGNAAPAGFVDVSAGCTDKGLQRLTLKLSGGQVAAMTTQLLVRKP